MTDDLFSHFFSPVAYVCIDHICGLLEAQQVKTCTGREMPQKVYLLGFQVFQPLRRRQSGCWH